MLNFYQETNMDGEGDAEQIKNYSKAKRK